MSSELTNYHAALKVFASGDFECTATDDVLRVLLPHLDVAEVTQVIADANTHDRLHVIGPPLLIRGSEQVFTLSREGRELKCRWAGSYRRKESFYHRSLPLSQRVFKDFDYRDRVANYAETHWGSSLIWDKGRCHNLIKLVDPRKLNKFHQLDVQATALSILTSKVEELAELDAYPLPQYIEQATLFTTADPFQIAEILGGSPPGRVDCFCALCGAGLSEKECNFCGATVVANPALWEPRDYPVSLKATLELDWEFEIAPDQAWRSYYMDWGHAGLKTVPKTNRKRSRERNIQLRDK